MRAGDVFKVDIPNEKTDHFWIMVTEITEQGEIAFVMLTDSRNLDFPDLTFPQGTPAWNGFKLTKDTAVPPASARLGNSKDVLMAVNSAAEYCGRAEPDFLAAIRSGLLHSNQTPMQVMRAISAADLLDRS